MSVIEVVRRLVRPGRPVGWRISAPFLYSLEFSGEMPPEAWRTIIARIAPYATEVFLEDLLGHPQSDAVLTLCDGQAFRFHLTTHGAWAEPRAQVKRLRALKHLAMLRFRLPDDPDGERGKRVLADLKFAVDAGLEVWGLVAVESADPARLPDEVARLHDWGVKGFALLRCSAANEATRAVYEQAAELRRAGYAIVLDDCAPAGLPGRCRGLLGSCVVDAQGNVKACRHSSLVLGNLLEDDIAAIWSSPKTEDLRAGLPASGAGPYRRGCPFEAPGGAAKDSAALEADETPPVELDPSLVPVPLYRLRHEPFGAVLIKGYDFIPVSRAGWRIAEAFDGRRTLHDLRRRFGERAVLLAYGLFCEKMLRFSRKPPEHDVPVLDDKEAEA